MRRPGKIRNANDLFSHMKVRAALAVMTKRTGYVACTWHPGVRSLGAKYASSSDALRETIQKDVMIRSVSINGFIWFTLKDMHTCLHGDTTIRGMITSFR